MHIFVRRRSQPSCELSHLEVKSQPDRPVTFNIGFLAEIAARCTKFCQSPEHPFRSEFTINRLPALPAATKRALLKGARLQEEVHRY